MKCGIGFRWRPVQPDLEDDVEIGFQDRLENRVRKRTKPKLEADLESGGHEGIEHQEHAKHGCEATELQPMFPFVLKFRFQPDLHSS